MKIPPRAFASLLLALTASAMAAGQDGGDHRNAPPTPHQEQTMKEASPAAPKTLPVQPLPPDVARYLQGMPAPGRQFDFLIGDWDVAATRYKEDGSVLLQYRADWNAKHLNEGRMVMDDFRALGPAGQPVSSYVTLRTYCEATGRWEMAGLAALQPVVAAQWHGAWKDGEMRLDATGADAQGRTVMNKIRFFNIARDSFAWESRTSLDGGQTWALAAALTATRAAR